MKKELFALVLSCSFLLPLAACGNTEAPANSNTAEPANSPNESTSEYTEADIYVSCSDLKSNQGKWHRYAINVSHETDQYLTAEILGVVSDADGNELGRERVFVNNLGPTPGDWDSVPFLAQNTTGEAFFNYEIISYSFLPGWPEMPEISDDNICDYIRIETYDYGDTAAGDLEVCVDAYNLTPQEFTGVIDFTVTDAKGNTLLAESKQIDSLDPFGDTSLILWVPECDDYTVQYDVVDYQFCE